MGLPQEPQKNIVTAGENWYSRSPRARTLASVPGQAVLAEYIAPVIWRHDVQWQQEAWRGRLEIGMGALTA